MKVNLEGDRLLFGESGRASQRERQRQTDRQRETETETGAEKRRYLIDVPLTQFY